MVNRRLLIIGAVVALIFGGAIFALSFMNAAVPPVEILAARQDISEGTLVEDIPDDTFARINSSQEEMKKVTKESEEEIRKMAEGISTFAEEIKKMKDFIRERTIDLEL